MASALAPRPLLLAALAAPLLAASARAEEPIVGKPIPDKPIAEKVWLDYVRGPGSAQTCPSERVLRHAILTRMKVDPFSPAAKAKLRVRIVGVGGMFEASYEIIDSDGAVVLPRTMALRETCGLAVEDLALSVSVHLPMLITGGVPRSCEEPVETPMSEAPPSKPPPLTERPFSVLADSGVLTSEGSAPSTAYGFFLHAGVRWRSLSLSLGYRQEFPASIGLDTTRLTTWRKLGEVAPCGHLDFFRDVISFNFSACGLLQIGELSIKKQTSDELSTDQYLNVSVGGRIGVGVTLSSLPRLTFFLPIDVTAIPRRETLRVGTSRRVGWTPEQVLLAVGLGVGFRLWP